MNITNDIINFIADFYSVAQALIYARISALSYELLPAIFNMMLRV
jgi:hypothetical protein